MKREFEARLERPEGIGTWTFLTVPFSVPEEFGVKGQVKVKGTVNGVPVVGSLMPHGDGRHFLVVKQEVRDQAGVSAGDSVQVTLERDTAERTVSVPADFADALARSPEAGVVFEGFSYSHKKEYVDWIESAKRPETRQARIEKALALIADRKRLKG